MAEILGAVASSLTVAALFKVCIEAFDLIQTSRHQDVDLQKLTIRFEIEKCRLYVWGEAMGLTAPQTSGNSRTLEASKFGNLVCTTLQMILDTFRDTQKMKQQYGCREVPLKMTGNAHFLNNTAAIRSGILQHASQTSRLQTSLVIK